MARSRRTLGRIDGVLLLAVAAWALATPLLSFFRYNILAAAWLPSRARLPLRIIFSMANVGGLWVTDWGSFVIGLVLAACGWGIWCRKAWAANLLFAIAIGNILILSAYLIRLGIPGMLRARTIDINAQAMLLTLSYYGSVVFRVALGMWTAHQRTKRLSSPRASQAS